VIETELLGRVKDARSGGGVWTRAVVVMATIRELDGTDDQLQEKTTLIISLGQV
jgi:hypothetical protein